MIEGDTYHCDHEGCVASVKAHRWGMTKAHGKGWFFSRGDDVAWCPDHLPKWVGEWRTRNKIERKLY